MNAISKYHYISFDIFDTLIKRNVAQPTDLFRLMECYCINKGIDIPKDFSEKRITAEKTAADKNEKPIGIYEIYQELQENSDNIPIDLVKLEIQFELDYCQPNRHCVELFQLCIREGKTVVLTSDMYLPSSAIKKMLEKCGVKGYKKLYVSCDKGGRKSNKSLYRMVLHDLNITPDKLLHIGDNLKSDYLIPLSMGIQACHVPNYQRHLLNIPKSLKQDSHLAYRTMQACIANCSQDMNEYERLGCETLGPLLLGFTKWLLNQLRRDGIHDVYFMSRDGYTMKIAFDMLENKDIQSHYLYCSRRSYTVPLIWKHSEFEEIFQNITIPKKTTLRTFILCVGLEPEKYCEKAKIYNLDLDFFYENDSLKYSQDVRLFYDAIREDIIVNSKMEYDALLAYIRNCSMQGRIAIVDIGWHGTMQNAFIELIEEAGLNVKIKGYYVGISPDADLVNERKIKAAGYLCKKDKNEELREMILKFIPIFETVFLAQHGSVNRFVIEDGRVYPQLCAYEYENDENKYVEEISIIRNYQQGAFKFIDKMKSGLLWEGINISPHAALYNMAKMGIKPTLSEAKLWGDFRMFDITLRTIARPRYIRVYLKSPRLLRSDFIKCAWKIGFLRRLFRGPLPYNAIYMFLKRYYYNG